MTFDTEYFENENRSELYVYLAAEKDKDVFSEYAWNLTHDEELTENILHREIYLLKEKGVTF